MRFALVLLIVTLTAGFAEGRFRRYPFGYYGPYGRYPFAYRYYSYGPRYYPIGPRIDAELREADVTVDPIGW